MSFPNSPSVTTALVNLTKPTWFHGVLAVMIFSLTAPLTSMALDAFIPGFIAFMRALIAGIGSLALVIWFKWPIPTFRDMLLLIVGGVPLAILFPYTLAESLLIWEAKDMGVVLAGIPLFTALVAVGIFKEKTSIKFWLGSLAGTSLLILFAYSQSHGVINGSLIIMLFSAGLGYAVGGDVAKRIGGFQTICWIMVLFLPVACFGVGYTSFENSQSFQSDNISSIIALLYLAIMSQWIGFRFWYDSMVKIGIAQTGQFQMLQPFFTLLLTVPLLGASLTLVHWVFAVLVTACVWFVRQSR